MKIFLCSVILPIILVFIVFQHFVIAEDKSPNIEIEGRYWFPELDGTVNVSDLTYSGSDLDFKDDLSIGDENFPELRFTLHINPKDKLRLAYTEIDYEGDKILSKTIQFKRISFAADAQISSNLEAQYLRIGWIRDGVNLAKEKLKISSLIEAKILWADASLRGVGSIDGNPVANVEESEKFIGGMPTLGIKFDAVINEKMLNLFGEISYLPVAKYGEMLGGLWDEEVGLWDGEIGVRVNKMNHFELLAGYRLFDIEIKDDDDNFEMEMLGPFVSANIRF